MIPIGALEIARTMRRPTVFGPVVLPDGPNCFSVLFQIPDEHVGWSLDTYVSLDYGLTWHHGGGCGRMGRTAHGYRGLRSSGLSFGCLPLGTGRLFRVVVTCLEPRAMVGTLSVGHHPFPLFIGPEHHSVAFDGVGGVVGGNGQTTLTTASFTIAGTERAGVLGLAMGNNTSTSFTGSIGGVSGSLVSGTDSGTAGTTRTMIFGVIAPATGTQTGTMSWTTAEDSSLDCLTATGVDQATPFNNGAFNNTDGSNSASVSVSSTTGDMTFAVCAAANGAASISVDSQTSRWTGGTGSTKCAGSTGDGAASNSHTFTASSGNATCTSGCNFKAAGGAPAEQPPYRIQDRLAPLLAYG
jgi:hypothetical protein